MWPYIAESDQLFCSEPCIWNYGKVLHRRRLEAIRAMAQMLLDEAEVEVAHLNNIVIKSQTTISDIESLRQQVQVITNQLDKVGK